MEDSFRQRTRNSERGNCTIAVVSLLPEVVTSNSPGSQGDKSLYSPPACQDSGMCSLKVYNLILYLNVPTVRLLYVVTMQYLPSF